MRVLSSSKGKAARISVPNTVAQHTIHSFISIHSSQYVVSTVPATLVSYECKHANNNSSRLLTRHLWTIIMSHAKLTACCPIKLGRCVCVSEIRVLVRGRCVCVRERSVLTGEVCVCV